MNKKDINSISVQSFISDLNFYHDKKKWQISRYVFVAVLLILQYLLSTVLFYVYSRYYN